jgi:hypothetical protein
MSNLQDIKIRFNNRLHDSEKYEQFLMNHEPDVGNLLEIVEELDRRNEKDKNSIEWLVKKLKKLEEENK